MSAAMKLIYRLGEFIDDNIHEIAAIVVIAGALVSLAMQP